MKNGTDAKGSTAGAGRAAREAAVRPPQRAAPLHPSGGAVAGPGRDERTERGQDDRARAHPEHTREPRVMREEDELQALRAGVSGAAVLENMASGWKLDARQSTRRALKYRRGAGEVLIVNHDGRGWWDPLSDAKGDVFTLVQHLEPGLNFGQVRQILRRFLGLTPVYVAQRSTRQGRGAGRTPAERWELRPRLRPRSAA